MIQRWLLAIGALAGIVFVLIPALRHGWTRVETDFPNYYTAAVLARRHAPLRNFYDWTWFQRQMSYTGTERQLGGYIPHPPLAMLPILPLAGLPPQPAKQVWLAFNVVFLLAAIWILSRLSRVSAPGLMLLATAGYQAIQGNFHFGQWYIFLLLLLSLSFWLLLSGRDWSAGAILGAVCVMKLYTAPFLLYFVWKRRWRALAGMLAVAGVLLLASVAWFGFDDHLYYLTGILARASNGEGADPYAPGLATLPHLLRHALMAEPELNPHPLANSPAALFFFQPLITLAVLVFCLIALPRHDGENQSRDLSWFLIAVLLMAAQRAFYADILFLIPVALLFRNARRLQRVSLVATYLLLTISMPASWARFFPVIWILLGLYIAIAIPYWRALRPRNAIIAAAALVCVATFAAYSRVASYRVEPPQGFERATVIPRAIFSASPAAFADGIVHESMVPGRYELVQWKHGTRTTFSFEGNAFHPTVPFSGDTIYFELVASGRSQVMKYEPATRLLRKIADGAYPSVAPDGSAIAYIAGDNIVTSSKGVSSALNVRGPVRDVSWFPIGRTLVYSAGPIGNGQIYTTQSSAPLTHGAGDHTEPAISPNGKLLAFTLTRHATKHVWILDLETERLDELTQGACNSYQATWEPATSRQPPVTTQPQAPSPQSLIFACDCQRAVGETALYRATIPQDFHSHR